MKSILLFAFVFAFFGLTVFGYEPEKPKTPAKLSLKPERKVEFDTDEKFRPRAHCKYGLALRSSPIVVDGP